MCYVPQALLLRLLVIERALLGRRRDVEVLIFVLVIVRFTVEYVLLAMAAW